jgi:hypothetical protein
MNGWTANDVQLPGQVIAGVVTSQVVSKEYAITAGGSLHHVVKVKASSVTVVGAISATLQTAIGSDWVATKSVSITAAGSFYIKLNVEVTGDQTHLPLLNKGRIVITTTNAGDAVTIDSIDILQEL